MNKFNHTQLTLLGCLLDDIRRVKYAEDERDKEYWTEHAMSTTCLSHLLDIKVSRRLDALFARVAKHDSARILGAKRIGRTLCD